MASKAKKRTAMKSGFRRAIVSVPALAAELHDGLDALRGQDRKLTSCSTGTVTGSVDLDAAYQEENPNGHRWDYAIGHKGSSGTEKAVYVEFHTASSSEVSVVLKKRDWLISLLRRGEFEALSKLPMIIVWVASGRFDIPKHTPHYKRALMAGIMPRTRFDLASV